MFCAHWVWVPVVLVSVQVAQAARIEMEIGTQPGAPPTTMQRWYQLLTELKVDSLRIRSLSPSDKLGIVTTGTPTAPVYRITAVLNQRDELVLPQGQQFRLADRQRLQNWLDTLRSGGPEGFNPAPPKPYGLTDEQLAAVRDDLKSPIEFETKEQSLTAFLNKVRGQLRHPVMADPAAVPVLTSAAPLQEELQGLSAGTAMAAALRPSALALVPQRDSLGKLQYVVSPARAEQEAWPVGGPLPRPGRDIVPPMYELINSNIENVPLSQVLEVVAGRLKLPVLMDQQALARDGIDLTQVRVNLPPRQMTYYDVLAKTLFQARLKQELRVDEAGKPFLWITTIK